MTSGADSNSSSLSLSDHERSGKKLHKRLKKKFKKKEKKTKSQREKKLLHKDVRKVYSKHDKQFEKPKKYEVDIVINEMDDAFGPALPPHLLNKGKQVESNAPLVVGPVFPAELLGNVDIYESKNLSEKSLAKELATLSKSENDDGNLQDCYGPSPITNELEMTPVQLELEHRALELKMAAIDGINPQTSNQNVREEWMVELPSIRLKGGLAALNNLKRGFHQGKEKPDFSDRTSWTKTPDSGQAKHKSANSKEALELRTQALYEEQRNAEQEALAKKHKKKHKRKESLVEIHQKKLRKEKKKKAKELEESATKPERRPFTRDVDLKINKIDRNQTKQIVDKAKILNTKFSTGHSKYL